MTKKDKMIDWLIGV